MGGTVTYANSAKTSLLGVSESAIEQYGAVSDKTAAEMAKCIIEKLNADIAVSATGISGPNGGTPQKPVGTVYIGISAKKGERTQLFRFGNIDRNAVRAATCSEA